jgi:hypothetical protein
MNFQILIFEDDRNRAEKFIRNLRMAVPEFTIHSIHEVDNSNLQNIIVNHGHTLNLILIDRDLNDELKGHDVIEEIVDTIDNNVDMNGIKIIYYSSITSVNELLRESKSYGVYGCCNFTDLERKVIELINQ